MLQVDSGLSAGAYISILGSLESAAKPVSNPRCSSLSEINPDSAQAEVARSIARQAVEEGGRPRVAVIPEGPYVIPFISK